LNLKRSIFFSLVSFSLICFSCGGSRRSENAITEGVIEYKASVINENHPLASFAPSTATVKIKNDKWILEMSTMGIFNIYFSCNLENKTLAQMIKYMDIKNACVENDSMLIEENNKYKLTFKETNETKMIAGYKCKKVIATKVSDPSVTFDVYYTPDIGSENSNELTPYKELKGMPLDYRVLRLGLEMHFVATCVKSEEIKDSDFDVPSYYKILNRPEFDKEFNRLFADFF
jgi:hypothetical protein